MTALEILIVYYFDWKDAMKQLKQGCMYPYNINILNQNIQFNLAPG